MNLLSVLSKLDEQDVSHIRCWLRVLNRERNEDIHPYNSYQVPADVALLKKEMLRIGAEAWVQHCRLPPQLTHHDNVTAETARKIFGEDS